MSKRHSFILALVVSAISLTGVALAMTVNQTISPASIKEKPEQFSVSAEKRDDGLMHFTITHHLRKPSYLVAITEMRENGKLAVQTTSTSFCRDDSATFYLAIPPERLADAKFELFEGTFAESDHHPVAIPGGVQFQIQLDEFARNATEVKK